MIINKNTNNKIVIDYERFKNNPPPEDTSLPIIAANEIIKIPDLPYSKYKEEWMTFLSQRGVKFINSIEDDSQR